MNKLFDRRSFVGLATGAALAGGTDLFGAKPALSQAGGGDYTTITVPSPITIATNGDWGLRNRVTVFNASSFVMKKPIQGYQYDALTATVYVQSIQVKAFNTPAYRINIGSVAFYKGGDIHDYNGVKLVDNGGALESHLGKAFTILPGDEISYQLANSGSFNCTIAVLMTFQVSRP